MTFNQCIFLFYLFYYRHLSSELAEMLVVIDTLMKEEFEKYSTADLNRPLIDSEPLVLEAVRIIYFLNLVNLILFLCQMLSIKTCTFYK